MCASGNTIRRKVLEDVSHVDHLSAIENLSDYLTLLNLLFHSISKVLVEECGLTTLQYRMLLRLLAAEGKTLRTTDLAENLYVGVSTVSAAVPKLVEEGFVCRAENPDDMRVVSLSLVPRGVDKIKHADFSVGSFLRGYWKNLTSEQLKAGLASCANAVRLHGAERVDGGDFRYDTAFFDAIMISRTLTSARLSCYGLKTQELRILVALRILGPNTTASQVAKYLLLNSSDVTMPLKTLEAKGLIEKKRNDENRRAKILSLTPEGQKKVEEMLPISHDALLETCHSDERAVEIHLSAARNVVAKVRGSALFV